MERKDYTYILLFDKEFTEKIKDIQKNLKSVLGYSEYADQWDPHATVSFGNILSKNELEEVSFEIKKFFADQKSFSVSISNVVVHEKTVQGETYNAIRLKIASTPEMETLSQKMVSIAGRKEVPFDAFTQDHFHIGLGRYQASALEGKNIHELISIENLSPVVKSLSVHYSMLNTPKPEKAYSVASVPFI